MVDHTHGNGKPCYGCFQDYVDRNGGLPTAPMDFEERSPMHFLLSQEDRKLLEELRHTMTTFAQAIAQLQTDVTTLISQEGSISAALAAKDTADAAAVAAVDATVVAAITPAAPAPAAPAPVVPAAPAA